jgi:hypothetical protein
LLAVVNGFVCTAARRPLLTVFLAGAVAVGLQFFAQCFFPAVLLQALLVVVVAVPWRILRWRRWAFVALGRRDAAGLRGTDVVGLRGIRPPPGTVRVRLDGGALAAAEAFPLAGTAA